MYKLEPFSLRLEDFQRKFRVHFPGLEYSVKEYDGYIFRSFQSISITTPATSFRIDTVALPYCTEYQLHINHGNYHDVKDIIDTIGLKFSENY